MRARALIIHASGLLVVAAAVLGLHPGGAAAATRHTATSATALTVGGAIETSGPAQRISPLLLGANGHWYDQNFGGWDPGTQSVYPAFARAEDEAGIAQVRYPSGTAANLFQWQRSIGPLAARTPQVGLSNGTLTAPTDDDYGLDEYARASEQAHRPGDIMVNFATGTPEQAAEEVDYLTGRVGAERIDGVDWAALRARNGHPAPYDMPYWEIGNEASSANQLYWRGGATSQDPTQLYAFGGSTTFTQQPVATADDYRPSAAISDGAPGQVRQVQYPPVAAGTGQVFVGSQPWTETSDLATSPAGADVYTLDRTTGAITFGDGQHGAIPPAGAQITISYTSGPHGGFTAFYAAMKQANPRIRICAGLSGAAATEQFAAIMGTQHPYDCVQHHAYISSPASAATLTTPEYYDQVLAAEPEQTGEVGDIEQAIDADAGSRAPGIGVVVTEYGSNGTQPTSDPEFQGSLGEAVLMGDDLIAWSKLGVPEADKSNLNGFAPGEEPTGPDYPVQADQLSGLSMIVRTGVDQYVLRPTALVSDLFRPLTDGIPTAVTVTPDPQFTAGAQSLPALDTLASRQADGTVEIFVVNRDPDQAVSTELRTASRDGGAATVSTISGPDLSSTNSDDATAVQTRTRVVTAANGRLAITFPPHSITRVALRPDARAPLGVRLRASPLSTRSTGAASLRSPTGPSSSPPSGASNASPRRAR